MNLSDRSGAFNRGPFGPLFANDEDESLDRKGQGRIEKQPLKRLSPFSAGASVAQLKRRICGGLNPVPLSTS